MRKKILAFVFAAALLVALAVPLFGAGSVYAGHDRGKQKSNDTNVAVCHKGSTIWVDADGSAEHLTDHEDDTEGVCNAD